MRPVNRRTFLKLAGATTIAGVALGSPAVLALSRFQPVAIGNPLEDYPNRDWETV